MSQYGVGIRETLLCYQYRHSALYTIKFAEESKEREKNHDHHIVRDDLFFH